MCARPLADSLEGMTETASSATTSTRLERPRDSAFKGVCSAIARATGTDAVLWRVLVIVLMLFHGLGAVLYLAGIVAIPREDEEQSLGERLLNGPDRRLSRNQILLLLFLGLLVLLYIGNPSGIVVASVAAVMGFVWWRGRGEGPLFSPPAAAPFDATIAPEVERTWTPPPPVPPRPRSPLGPVTVSLAAVVAGVLALIGATGTDVPAAVPIAAALGIVGIGLVVGSFFGRSWGLFLLAGFLTAALGVAAAVQPLLDDGVGDRSWSPTGSASYRLGAGQGVLDLSDVAPKADITARVHFGQLLVEVPEGLPVVIDARSEFGDVELFGKNVGGRHEHQVLSDSDATVHLHLSVRAGEVKVVRK
jgi:phage shock protein PspC (stress-responsive transcriptional regulator)